ncbi:MAG: twin-arginine translocase TatA/TatE family subunit [Myxococcales bacterium]|nr:twin-arginine translocase TatA/TatE family subunit [Myxococcales bacterium]MCB9707517.1 twin-arginine translocase TatA/TatE family subunit [Myxococcales bacterium]
MLGIGSGELLIIAIILLIAVGPDRMPTLMKAAGRALKEFRKATQDLRRTVGIDELLRDEPPEWRRRQELPLDTTQDSTAKPDTEASESIQRDMEYPPDGVDVAHIEHTAKDAPDAHD